MMIVNFLLFTALGIFFCKASKADPKIRVGWIIAIAVFWGYVSKPIWGLAALGEINQPPRNPGRFKITFRPRIGGSGSRHNSMR